MSKGKKAKRARRRRLILQTGWAYQCAGLLLMAPDSFRSERARSRAREWLLDVLADTAHGRRSKVGLIAYWESQEVQRLPPSREAERRGA